MSDEEKRRWRPKPGAGGGVAGGGGRALHERVKAVKGRTPSQRAWIERQLNDPYVKRAKEEGWRSRAAFKLLELDERHGLLRRGLRVVDLGAAPGGWTQVALKRGAGAVVGIDLLPIEPIAGATLLEMDFLAPEAESALTAALGGRPDLVLSDMAANTTGHARTDQIKTGALAEAATLFALEHLAPGGAFVTKAFQGGLDSALLGELKRGFDTVRHAKPPASRPESPELYVVAQGRRTTP
ncbi:MAG: RlmE family RNA methyltransferase [Alphaproteobacteria bacterium]|nr:RlmE family RNA methyltransferase [Alphaproteobacteria bacterium]